MNDYNKSTFPDPLATTEDKVQNAYGLAYAKALVVQWGGIDTEGSLYRRRFKDFETSRQYANGTQDTSIYKQILNSLDANNGDGTMMTLDWTPVPIIPKFAKIVVNKIISSYRYPQVEAIDPLSQNEKDIKKKKIALRIENKEMFQEAKNAGLNVDVDPEKLPQTPEEVEIFLDTNIKTDAEIAAQLATNLTLSWNNYDERVYRRTVEDLVNCGMAVTKRSNDPNYGIQEDYVDPAYFLHSYTDDPTFSDMVYAGHIKRISIMELKRLAGSQFTEEQYQKMAKTVMNRFGNNASRFVDQQYDQRSGSYNYGYDEYTLEILDFEFLSVDTMVYEKKQSRFGNIGFYYKGNSYEAPTSSVYDRDPVQMNNATVYGGIYITGTEYIFNYGQKNNVPKNIHDLTRARMSYSVVATNIRNMIPKSLVSGIIGFADQLQLSHLKIQQAIAKSKPDGIIIDIEGLENVDLGRGGDLQPLEIQDIYEQTGVFYYRSKNPEGGFQNAPVQQIDNRIRNINELIALYNHYLRMIRDATGINEVMDGTTPKGEALVGVNQMAVAAGNNALYDITNSAMIMYRKVCEDILKCLQILPEQSVLYNVYEKAIGKTNMKVLNSFKDLPMYNFGVQVMTDLNDRDRQYLEQNIQIALAQKEIDLEDAIAVRGIKDVDQAERLLVIRRKKRIAQTQAMQQANIQAQAQANAQASQASAQAEVQKEQAIAQIDMQKSQMEFEMKAQLAQLEHQMRLELETLRGEYGIAEQQIESNVKNTAEVMKEDRKDDRVKKQAVEQSKLISQRQGQRGELPEDSIDTLI
tara:strand:+ start:3106 stop:5517 length:2412 start_codon:yes stop_codon:yes gene_type:complete